MWKTVFGWLEHAERIFISQLIAASCRRWYIIRDYCVTYLLLVMLRVFPRLRYSDRDKQRQMSQTNVYAQHLKFVVTQFQFDWVCLLS